MSLVVLTADGRKKSIETEEEFLILLTKLTDEKLTTSHIGVYDHYTKTLAEGPTENETQEHYQIKLDAMQRTLENIQKEVDIRHFKKESTKGRGKNQKKKQGKIL